ncbi:polyunsaturated fatty acid 5-lipoxygenase-like isoform X2 [Xenia sp. Carnegie-2017]|nr:polyunsaturated fatty acid 5-lipoxygenase-like isoform X2 [Xenia sp. Carnegie-2017]
MTFKQAAALSWNDPVDYPWLVIYTYLQTKSLKMLAERMKPGNSLVKEFKSIDDFQRLLQLVRTIFTKDGKYLDYFRYPSLVEKWKDIIRCQTWHDDQVFVEERLAALNPMSLERVTADIDYFSALPRVGLRLTERLNRNYNWNRTVSNVVGRPTTLYKMAREKSLFAIHYPYLDDLPNVDDITEKRTERRRLKNATSPIAIFVSVKRPGKDSYELKPVAIQTDCHSDSPVYTPHDGKRWLLAKYLFQLADFSYVEMVEHLLKTHTILQPICVILKRTISRQHPLNEMLKWHCRGLIATNANGFAKLIQPHGYMHTLFSMGHLGSIELLNRAYQNYSWKDNDFWENIKSRGVDDPVKLPYYPYRDDGYLIWKQLHSYVREYVSLYYYNNNDVRRDFELRAFTTELSEKGMGKLKGFPSMLQSKYELIKTLTRILWLPVQHNAVNYPIAYYGAFVPNMPSKLYDDARSKTNEFSFNTLPNSNVSTVQAVVSMGLGSLRFDQLLDYGAQMLDKEAGEIVKKHHHILMTRVRDIIDERNEKRYSASHLTYPYLKPGWIPNSIHT